MSEWSLVICLFPLFAKLFRLMPFCLLHQEKGNKDVLYLQNYWDLCKENPIFNNWHFFTSFLLNHDPGVQWRVLFHTPTHYVVGCFAKTLELEGGLFVFTNNSAVRREEGLCKGGMWEQRTILVTTLREGCQPSAIPAVPPAPRFPWAEERVGLCVCAASVEKMQAMVLTVSEAIPGLTSLLFVSR